MVEPLNIRVIDGEELLRCGSGVQRFGKCVHKLLEDFFDLLHSGGRDVEKRHYDKLRSQEIWKEGWIDFAEVLRKKFSISLMLSCNTYTSIGLNDSVSVHECLAERSQEAFVP